MPVCLPAALLALVLLPFAFSPTWLVHCGMLSQYIGVPCCSCTLANVFFLAIVPTAHTCLFALRLACTCFAAALLALVLPPVAFSPTVTAQLVTSSSDPCPRLPDSPRPLSGAVATPDRTPDSP
jgi:hypothetical protein